MTRPSVRPPVTRLPGRDRSAEASTAAPQEQESWTGYGTLRYCSAVLVTDQSEINAIKSSEADDRSGGMSRTDRVISRRHQLHCTFHYRKWYML
jgi:hypothetical protein